MTQETNYTAESSTSVRIQKMNKMACWTLHGTGRNMYHWEMAASHLHKGNCRVIHKHYYFCNGTVQVYGIYRKWRNGCYWEMPALCLHKV